MESRIPYNSWPTSTTVRYIAIVVGVVLAVGLVTAGPVAGQLGTQPNNTSNASDGGLVGGSSQVANNTTGAVNNTSGAVGGAANGSANGSVNGSDVNVGVGMGVGSQNGGGGGGGGLFPDAGEMLEDMLKFIVNELEKNVANFLDQFNEIILGVPAPGNIDNPASMVQPDNGWWSMIVPLYGVFASLSALLLFPVAMAEMGSADMTEKRAIMKRTGFALFHILGGLIYLPIILHGAHEFSLSLAPSGEEFLATAGNLGKLGVGVILGALLLITQYGIVLLGVSILFAMFVLIHLGFALWPTFALARVSSNSTAQWYGALGFTALVGLVILRGVQSIVLRIMFEIPWEPISNGGGTVVALFGTMVILAVALVWLPKIFAQKALPASMLAVGGTITTKGKEAPANAAKTRERVGSAVERLQDLRNTSSNDTPSQSSGSSGNSPSPSASGSGSATPTSFGVTDSNTSGDEGSSGSGGGGGGGSATGLPSSGDLGPQPQTGLDAQQIERQREQLNQQINRSYR